MDSTGVITQDKHSWDSDPFKMLPHEDLPLHRMFSLHNVRPETLQGDFTRGNFVEANRIPHSSHERECWELPGSLLASLPLHVLYILAFVFLNCRSVAVRDLVFFVFFLLTFVQRLLVRTN